MNREKKDVNYKKIFEKKRNRKNNLIWKEKRKIEKE